MFTETIPSNVSQNVSMSSSLQGISRPAVMLMRCQGTIIVFLNFTVLITLISKKSKFPAVYWLQIVCLAFNDVIAGLANVLISFIDLPSIKENVTNCSIAIVFLFSSQSASLYNIFGICVHRFVVIKRSDASSSVWKHQHTLLCTSLAWIISLSLSSLPAVLYQKPDGYNKIKVCSVQPLFGADVNKGMLILVGSFIIPLMFTNVLYIMLFCILKSLWNSAKPVFTSRNTKIRCLCQTCSLLEGSNIALRNRTTMVTTVPGQSDLDEGKSVETELTEQRDETKVAQSHGGTNSLPSFDRAKKIPGMTKQNKHKSMFLQFSKRQKAVELISVSHVSEKTASTSADQFYSDNGRPTCSLSRCKPLTKSRHNVPQTLLRQRKAYTFLGMILLFLNIFTWPGIAALVLTSMINVIPLGRATLLPLFTTICINSAVNPILYTITISEFRSAVFDLLLSIYKLVKC